MLQHLDSLLRTAHFTLRMEIASTYETLMSYHTATWRRKSEDLDLDVNYCLQKLKGVQGWMW
jgi:hypothetical protein